MGKKRKGVIAKSELQQKEGKGPTSGGEVEGSARITGRVEGTTKKKVKIPTNPEKKKERKPHERKAKNLRQMGKKKNNEAKKKSRQKKSTSS